MAAITSEMPPLHAAEGGGGGGGGVGVGSGGGVGGGDSSSNSGHDTAASINATTATQNGTATNGGGTPNTTSNGGGVTISAAADSSDNQPGTPQPPGGGGGGGGQQQQTQLGGNSVSDQQQQQASHHPYATHHMYASSGGNGGGGGAPATTAGATLPHLYGGGIYASAGNGQHDMQQQQQQGGGGVPYSTYLNSYEQFYQQQAQLSDYGSNSNGSVGGGGGGGNSGMYAGSNGASAGVRYHPYLQAPTSGLSSATTASTEPGVAESMHNNNNNNGVTKTGSVSTSGSMSPRVVSSTSPTSTSTHLQMGGGGGISGGNPGSPGCKLQCKKCGIMCTNESELQEHITNVHGASPYGGSSGYSSSPYIKEELQGGGGGGGVGGGSSQHSQSSVTQQGNGGNPGDILDLDSQKMVYPPMPGIGGLAGVGGGVGGGGMHGMLHHPGAHHQQAGMQHGDTDPLHSMHTMQQRALPGWDHPLGGGGVGGGLQEGLPAYMQPHEMAGKSSYHHGGIKQEYPLIKSEYAADSQNYVDKSFDPTGEMCQQAAPPSQQQQQQQQVGGGVPATAMMPVSSSPAEFPSTTTGPQQEQQQQYRGFEPPTSSSALPASNITAKAATWKSNEARRPKTYNCTACNKWFTSSGHLKRHYNTTLHKNAVKSSGQPDPATLPISAHHHPARDPNHKHSRRSNAAASGASSGGGGGGGGGGNHQQQPPAPVQPPEPPEAALGHLAHYAGSPSPTGGAYGQQQNGYQPQYGLSPQVQSTTNASPQHASNNNNNNNNNAHSGASSTTHGSGSTSAATTTVLNGHPNGLAGPSAPATATTATTSLSSSHTRGLLNTTTTITIKSEPMEDNNTNNNNNSNSNNIMHTRMDMDMDTATATTHSPMGTAAVAMDMEEAAAGVAAAAVASDEHHQLMAAAMQHLAAAQQQAEAQQQPYQQQLEAALAAAQAEQLQQQQQQQRQYHSSTPNSSTMRVRSPHIISQQQPLPLVGYHQTQPMEAAVGQVAVADQPANIFSATPPPPQHRPAHMQPLPLPPRPASTMDTRYSNVMTPSGISTPPPLPPQPGIIRMGITPPPQRISTSTPPPQQRPGTITPTTTSMDSIQHMLDQQPPPLQQLQPPSLHHHHHHHQQQQQQQQHHTALSLGLLVGQPQQQQQPLELDRRSAPLGVVAAGEEEVSAAGHNMLPPLNNTDMQALGDITHTPIISTTTTITTPPLRQQPLQQPITSTIPSFQQLQQQASALAPLEPTMTYHTIIGNGSGIGGGVGVGGGGAHSMFTTSHGHQSGHAELLQLATLDAYGNLQAAAPGHHHQGAQMLTMADGQILQFIPAPAGSHMQMMGQSLFTTLPPRASVAETYAPLSAYTAQRSPQEGDLPPAHTLTHAGMGGTVLQQLQESSHSQATFTVLPSMPYSPTISSSTALTPIDEYGDCVGINQGGGEGMLVKQEQLLPTPIATPTDCQQVVIGAAEEGNLKELPPLSAAKPKEVSRLNGSAIPGNNGGAQKRKRTPQPGTMSPSTTTLPGGRIKCLECDKEFTRICYLTQHNKSFHSGEYPWRCQKCGKRFQNEDIYVAHYARHKSVDKPHKCEICPKQFHHKTDLRRHVEAIHTGLKQHTCEVCEKSFCRKDHLRKHLETHTRPRVAVKKPSRGGGSVAKTTTGAVAAVDSEANVVQLRPGQMQEHVVDTQMGNTVSGLYSGSGGLISIKNISLLAGDINDVAEDDESVIDDDDEDMLQQHHHEQQQQQQQQQRHQQQLQLQMQQPPMMFTKEEYEMVEQEIALY